MSDIICPFCQQELKTWAKYTDGTSKMWCSKCNLFGDSKLFSELIRTRKELEQSEICCTEWEKQALDYKAENIALSGDLERTRKALDVAVDALKDIRCIYTGDQTTKPSTMFGRAASALNKITTLKQKDVE